jgi:sortase A
MMDERPIEVADGQQAGHSGANTGGLATRLWDPPGSMARPVTGSNLPPPPPTPAAPAVLPEQKAEDVAPTVDVATDRARSGSGLLRAGLVASTVGLCLLLFVGYVYSFSALQEHRSQRLLLNQFTTSARAHLLTGHTLSEGQPAGVLSIPAIGLAQVVVEGSSATDLLKGPGLMPGTAQPGSLGNAVIAGHRTIAGSPFAHLNALHAGDRIEVVTRLGAYHYRVIAVGSARPGAPDPTSPNRHPRLTLVTSGGTAASNGRTYVVASLVGTANSARIPRHPPTAGQRGLSGDAHAVLPAILWGLVLVGGFALTFLAYLRFRGRHWSIYMLSTPILLALTFLWYGNLIRLLPGTM